MSFTTTITGKENDCIIILNDISNDTKVEIFAFGAILNAFEIVHKTARINVIDGYKNPENAREHISSLYKSAKLSPFVGSLKHNEYQFAENRFKVNKQKVENGLLFDQLFSIVETKANNNFASVILQCVYDKNDEGYPFFYNCEVEYKLEENNQLTLTTTVANLDQQMMPIADGWQPFFTLGNTINECQLEFQSKEEVVLDDNFIPSGKFRRFEEFGSLQLLGDYDFKNCYTVNFAECQPMCVFRNPLSGLQVEIHPTKSYPYLFVYTPRHRNSISLINSSAPPNAFNNGMGLKVLLPGEKATFITRYIVKPL